MKKIVLSLILMVNYSYSQEFTSIYGMKCVLEDKMENKTEGNDLLSVLDTESDDVEFNLKYSNNESIFYYPEILRKGNNTVNISIIQAKNIGVYYSNIQSKTVLHQEFIFNEFFIIKDSIPKNWILTTETKKLGNYVCYKAEYHSVIKKTRENGDEYLKPIKSTAWYAPEIPYSTGPLGYGGLPGLILELHDDIFVYYLKEIDFKPKEKVKIAKPIKGKEVSKMEYSAIYKDLYRKKENSRD